MSDLLQTTTGDLEITNNNLTFVHAEDEVKQRLEQRLKTYKGEWDLDIDTGVEWLTDVMVKNPKSSLVEGLLKGHITRTPGVLEIKAFDLTFINATREMDLRFTVRSTTGDVEVEVTI
jgi:hypothetical protein